MKIRKICFVFIATLISSLSLLSQSKVGTTAAPFLGIAVGPRAIGLGGAFTAFSEDVSALYWNPAGISRLGRNEIMLSHTKWIFGTSFDWIGVGVGIDRNNYVGVSITRLDYGEEEVTTIDYPEGTGERWDASDIAVGISYARNLTDRFSVGGTVKFIQQKLWNERATGFALDVGVLFITEFRGLKLGASICNFGTEMQLDGKDLFVIYDPDPEATGNNPAISAKLKTDSWPLPLLFRVGVSIDVFKTETSYLTLAVDALHPNDNTESLNIGFEYGFRNLIFLRAGYKSLFQKDSQERFTVGVGIN
ncbi:MAG: PorV/PorQ family protein, partial [Candidatus Kryptonium sp.]